MLSLTKFSKNVSYLVYQARYKSKTHWAKLRKKVGPKHKAMSHFDEFYGSVFGKSWEPMREALLRRSKYVALVNNYGDVEDTIELLRNRGAHCLKSLMTVQQEFDEKYVPKQAKSTEQANSDDAIQKYSSKLQSEEISKLYSHSEQTPEVIETAEFTLKSKTSEASEEYENEENLTLKESLESAQIDESRIIDPSMGLLSESLYQYVPATKLKGMDDWVPESLHYSYYSKDQDFPLVTEPETDFAFPEHLKVFTYERDSDSLAFPEPRRGKTGVLNYYPLDCGSVLAVLALCLAPGDALLELCAAPGGKALVALQTLLPDVLVCNDVSLSRSNRMQRVFRDYLLDWAAPRWRERVRLSRVDARNYVDDRGYDKVLVDVPCTTDRHAVMEDENSLFRADRIRERLRIPEVQAAILVNGLKLVRPGGAVVYSTCSLSPVQNDGVVHMALKHAFQTSGIVAHVRDLSAPLAGLSSTLQLAAGADKPRYGQLVTPCVGANFGPSYFARLVRVK